MLAIEMEFLARTYHATSWGRQVNEGDVEWPPSPWRLLRALIATWHLRAYSRIDESLMRSIIMKLQLPPSFYLPPATIGHTRHYMPLYGGKPTKIFDAFVAFGRERSIYVIWPTVECSSDERAALDLLLSRLGYFGRAESWATAHVVDECTIQPNVMILAPSDQSAHDYERVRTLACENPAAYATWRTQMIEELQNRRLEELRAKLREKGKQPEAATLTKKDREAILASVPEDIFAALYIDTTDMKKKGWSQPPGSKWVVYARPLNALSVTPKTTDTSSRVEGPECARFAVSSTAPPRLTDALSVSERIHTSLVKYSDGSPTYTGCDAQGHPREGHQHAYIFCESNNALGRGQHGEITHAMVYAPRGFAPEDRNALERLKAVWGYGGYDIQLTLLAVGTFNDFSGIDMSRGGSPILGTACTWISRTPFIPTRYPKMTRAGMPKYDEKGMHIGSPEHDLVRLLNDMGFPSPKEIRRTHSTDLAGHETRWLDFRRERKNGQGKKSTTTGYGFSLVFDEPVSGPIALGYGAHFGLGLFIPADMESHES